MYICLKKSIKKDYSCFMQYKHRTRDTQCRMIVSQGRSAVAPPPHTHPDPPPQRRVALCIMGTLQLISVHLRNFHIIPRNFPDQLHDLVDHDLPWYRGPDRGDKGGGGSRVNSTKCAKQKATGIHWCQYRRISHKRRSSENLPDWICSRQGHAH